MPWAGSASWAPGVEWRGLAWAAGVVYLEAGGVVEVGGGGADERGVAAGGDGELVAGLVVVGQVAGLQAEQDEPALPGREVDLRVALELFGRLVCGGGRDEVELEGGRAGPRGGVLDLGGNGGVAAD